MVKISETTQVAVMANDIQYIKKTMDELKDILKREYVLKSEFEPVKKIVYGLVSVTMLAVITAILALVIKS